MPIEDAQLTFRGGDFIAKRANGEGMFTTNYDANGKVKNYTLRKMVGMQDNGRPKILTITAKSKNDCIKKMHIKTKEWLQSTASDEDVKYWTVNDLCHKHLDYDIQHRKSFKPKSIDRRESTIKNQIEGGTIGKGHQRYPRYKIGYIQVNALKPEDITNHIYTLLNDTDLSTESVKKAFDVINSAFNWGISRGYISANPCDNVKDELLNEFRKLEEREANDLRVNSLSNQEVLRLNETCKTRNKNNGELKYSASLYAQLLLYTGMRIGELCALRWPDIIHVNDKTVLSISKTRYVSKHGGEDVEEKYKAKEGDTKNNKARLIELSSDALMVLNQIEQLNKHHTTNGYIVLNEAGKATNPTNLGRCINTIFRAAGLRTEVSGAHILRKTFATQKYKEGVTIESIAAYIGDEPATVRKHYISMQETMADSTGRNINYTAAI